MKNTVSTKTITEADKGSGNFLIICFADKNSDGTTTPDIHKVQVLDSPKTIDGSRGKEGELLISSTDDSHGVINESGELEITVGLNDDVSKYNKEDENLTYER